MESNLRKLGFLAFLAIGVGLWMAACFNPSRSIPSCSKDWISKISCVPLSKLEEAKSKDDVRDLFEEDHSQLNEEARKSIARNTKADFLFIVAYTGFLGFMMWVLAAGRSFPIFRGKVSVPLALVFYLLPAVAAISDFGENIQLLKIVSLSPPDDLSRPLDLLKIFYRLKWGSVFLLTGLLSIFFFRAKKKFRELGYLYLLAMVTGLAGLFESSLMLWATLLLALGITTAALLFTLFSEDFLAPPDQQKKTRLWPSVQRLIKFLFGRVKKDQSGTLSRETRVEAEAVVGPEEDYKAFFRNTVFQAELKEIGIRRRNAKGLEEKFEQNTSDLHSEPTTDLGLVGLALSGGGIRSATFCLGAIQALAKNELFQRVDYLSTVSGGGYIGTCLSAMLRSEKEKTKWDDFPLRHICGQEEPEAIRHLRNSGNFVAPGGFIDRLRLAALLLRGIFLHFAMLIPYLIFAAWYTVFVNGDWLKNAIKNPPIEWSHYFCFLPWIIGLFLLWVLLFPIFHQVTKGNIDSRSRYERTFAALLFATIAVALMESVLPLYIWVRQLEKSDLNLIIGNLGAALSAASFLFTEKKLSARGRLAFTLGIYGVAIIGPLMLLALYFKILSWFGSDDFANWQGCILGLALLFFYLTRRFIDVNAISMNGFYRDRLSKAYLFEINDKDQVESNDNLGLDDIRIDSQSAAPYHLINATINLQGSKDVNLRGRMSDFFFFSKNYCGGLRTGFIETERLVNLDSHLDLGTAMAISGAAASANMGSLTIRPLVFLLALLNVRLGYWLPNPLRINSNLFRLSSMLPIANIGVGPLYFMRELLGMVNEKSNYINASDGGHLENLGIYELLRRKCKYIIAIDAEADPDLSFGSLAKLIRYARIDLSYDIDIDLQDVKLHEDGYSRSHCAMGKIYYGNSETGYLLYIKASLTGDENEYIREYAKSFPTFPHQTTADQFFDEAQFEVYRALGYHITDELFEQRMVEKEIETRFAPRQPKELQDWFEDLYLALKPRFQMENEIVDLQQELNGIESHFGEPEHTAYLLQNFPEIVNTLPGQKTSTPSKDPDFKNTFAICRQQLGFMQDAFIKLRLDQLRWREHYFNRGWMNLFRRWAQSKDFRRTWAMSIGTYSFGFQRFCEEALKIHPGIAWSFVKSSERASELTNREEYYFAVEQKAAGQDLEVWVLDMIVNLEPGEEGFGTIPLEIDSKTKQAVIRVGFAAIKHEKEKATLWGYRLRDFYRQMRLTDEMIPRLRSALQEKYGSDLRVEVRLTAEEIRLYGAFFKRHGYEVPDPDETNPVTHK